METAQAKEYIITLKGIDQSYGEKIVLSDINLKVRKGEFVTIVGPTGGGKSTLFRIILGSEKPLRGVAVMGDEPIVQPDSSRGIVFQKYSLFPDKTVKQNVMFGLELEYYSLLETGIQKLTRGLYKRKKQREFERITQEYLEKVGLWEARDKYPYELSGGMRQRAAIAQALIMKPAILLGDEPLGALDSSTREAMQIFMLDQWKASNSTVFFVTHDLEEALFLGTRLIVLSPYYQQDGTQGSKIITDIQLPWTHPRPTAIKKSEKFNELVEKIREDGLDPKHIQSIKDFNLTHLDAFHIV